MKSPEVDAYIAAAQPFAQPILTSLRKLVHDACPDIEESIKWGFPHFEKKGNLANMSGFKKHVSFGFWKGGQLADPAGILKKIGKTEMSAFRLEGMDDLPDKAILKAYILEAVALNEAGPAETKPAKKPRRQAKLLAVPDDLLDALDKNLAAKACFEAFPQSEKNEYIEWISGAKREATRAKRLATAIEWLAEGKRRNWKYM